MSFKNYMNENIVLSDVAHAIALMLTEEPKNAQTGINTLAQIKKPIIDVKVEFEKFYNTFSKELTNILKKHKVVGGQIKDNLAQFILSRNGQKRYFDFILTDFQNGRLPSKDTKRNVSEGLFGVILKNVNSLEKELNVLFKKFIKLNSNS